MTGRPKKERRSARVEFRARPSDKALWESLVDRIEDETFTDWMNAAARAYARKIQQERGLASAAPPSPPPPAVPPPAVRKKRKRRD